MTYNKRKVTMFYITKKNWDTILGFAEEAHESLKAEIGGMSVMVEDTDGDWILEDPVILKQVVSGGNCTLDKEELAKYYSKAALKFNKNNFRFCWWHSHHTMEAFWSSTDIAAIKEYDEGDFSFALVVNLKDEYKFRVSVWNPIEVHEDVDLTIMKPSRITKGIKKSVEKFCSKHVVTHIKTNKTKGWNWQNGYYGQQPGQTALPLSTTTVKQSDRLTYYEVRDQVDRLIDSLVDGTIDYKEYAKDISDLNATLKSEPSHFKVEMVSESDQSQLLYAKVDDFILAVKTDKPVYNDHSVMAHDWEDEYSIGWM